MSTQLLTKISQWARQQSMEQSARLRAQMEDLQREEDALKTELSGSTPAQTAGQQKVERDAVSVECAALESEVATMRKELDANRLAWCQAELQRRAGLLRKMRDHATAEEDALRLSQLDEVGSLLTDEDATFQWPELHELARARVKIGISKGAIAGLLKRCAALYSKVHAGIEAAPALTGKIQAAEEAVAALSARIAMLKDAAEKDKGHGFQSLDLARYYDELPPDDAHRLLEESLDRLCADAVIEIIHSRLHHRAELEAFLQTTPATS